MPVFIKREQFTKETLLLSKQKRGEYIIRHKDWVEKLIASGSKVASGYLTDATQRPGDGGLLIFQAQSFDAALKLVQQDPMISLGLVTWSLREWKPVVGELTF